MIPDRFCFLDIETTGFSPKFAEIIEIYIERYDGVVFETLINPRRSVPDEITKLTGISRHMLLGQPRLEDSIDEIADFLRGNILVAHNATFDLAFLQYYIAKLTSKAFPMQYFCTLYAARQLFDCDSYKLGMLARHLGYKRDIRHRAKSDCEAVKFVFRKIQSELCTKDVFSERKLLSHGYLKVFDKYCNDPNLYSNDLVSCQKTMIEFYYDGGSCPGQKRSILADSIFKRNGKTYFSGICTNTNDSKLFRLDRMSRFIRNAENDAQVKISSISQGVLPYELLELLKIPFLQDSQKNCPRKSPPLIQKKYLEQEVCCKNCKMSLKIESLSIEGIQICTSCNFENETIQIGKQVFVKKVGDLSAQLVDIINQLVNLNRGVISLERVKAFISAENIEGLLQATKTNKIELLERIEKAVENYHQMSATVKSHVFSCENCHQKIRVNLPLQKNGVYICPSCRSEYKAFELSDEILILPAKMK